MGSSSFPDVVSDAVLRARRTLAEEILEPPRQQVPSVASPMASRMPRSALAVPGDYVRSRSRRRLRFASGPGFPHV